MRHATHRRGWFQLSLRSIFLLMLVVAAYCAGYRTAVRRAERAERAEQEMRLQAEREAAEAIRAEEAATQAAMTSLLQAALAADNIELQREQANVEAEKAAITAELEAQVQLIKKKSDREQLSPFEEPKHR